MCRFFQMLESESSTYYSITPLSNMWIQISGSEECSLCVHVCVCVCVCVRGGDLGWGQHSERVRFQLSARTASQRRLCCLRGLKASSHWSHREALFSPVCYHNLLLPSLKTWHLHPSGCSGQTLWNYHALCSCSHSLTPKPSADPFVTLVLSCPCLPLG